MGEKYTTQATSGYNSSPPSDDGSETEANKVKYSTIKTKLADPEKTRSDNMDTAILALLDEGPDTKSTTYTTVATDHNKVIESSGTFTLSLLDAATAGAGYRVTVKNNGAGVVTVDTDTVADEIDGEVSFTLAAKEAVTCIVNNGADGYYRESISEASTKTVAKGGTGAVTHTAEALLVGDGTAPVKSLAVGTALHGVRVNAGATAFETAALDNVVFTKSFTSSEQTITSAGPLTLAHSLSATPGLISVQLICKTTQHNYSVDDVIFVVLSSPGNNRGVSIVPDGTNLNIRYSSASGAFNIPDKTSGADSEITNGSWKAIFRAYA